MRTSPVLTFRDAILGLVRAVPEVAELCGGRVYDAAPTRQGVSSDQLPQVSCGPAQLGRGENGHNPALGALRLRLFINSAEPGRDEVWTLAEAIGAALEGADPDIGGGYALIDCVRVINSGDVIDKISPSEVYLDITTIVQAV